MRSRLFDMADAAYRDFNRKLHPTLDPQTIIGVRVPVLRMLAAELARSDEAAAFLRDLPHAYHEENNLHAFLIERIPDFDACLSAVDAFLPFVDNWATCDMLSPKAFGRNPDKLLPQVRRWLDSGHVYTARFGVVMLMKHFLDKNFFPETMKWIASIHTDAYYLRMAQAWYFATALTKQYDDALPYIKEKRLDDWVHAKAIQKAVESRCISPERKRELRSLR